MKEITPVAGSTNFSSILCLKNFYFATLWQSAVLGAFKCQSVLASPKINRKNALGEMQFTEMSLAIFLLYLAVFDMWITSAIWIRLEYKCTWLSYQTRRLLNSYLRYTKRKKSKWKKTKQNKLFFYIFTSLHSKSGSAQWKIWNDTFENKKLVSPSFMVYLLGLN